MAVYVLLIFQVMPGYVYGISVVEHSSSFFTLSSGTRFVFDTLQFLDIEFELLMLLSDFNYILKVLMVLSGVMP